MTPLNDQQRLFLVESTQLYGPWAQARQHLGSYKYGMKWLTSKGKDYLYRVIDASGNARSLGPRSPETEELYQSFIDGWGRAKERFNGLDERMTLQARLNKAVNLGRLPVVVSEILQAIDLSKARDDFRIVGTHAIYAYESMAGAHLRMELLASGDVDLLYDPRKKLSLVAKNLNGNGLLGLLRKVDSSFDIVDQEPFRAVNKKGFMVDLIMPRRDMRHADPVSFAEGDMEAIEVPNLHWLANAPCVDSVIISANGMPVRAKVVDPRAFAVHKSWLSQQPDRDPVKKPRDLAQSKMVFDLINEYLPIYPLNASDMRYFPKAIIENEIARTEGRSIGTKLSLAKQWDAKPAKGDERGMIKALSDTEVIQDAGRSRHVVWERSKLTGATLEVDKKVAISRAGVVSEIPSRSIDGRL